MKSLTLIALTCFAFAAGCSSVQQPSITLAPIGPRQFPPDPHAVPRGTLVVYSEFEVTRYTSDSDQRYHSDYELRSVSGELIKRVFNRSGASSEDPAAVELAPGSYLVVARATGSQRVNAPVIIDAKETTCVRLDGSEPIGSKRMAASELVSLPDGKPVGWRVK